MIARNQLKLQISLAFGAFFRATDTGELSLAFTHLYLHLSRCSMLCRQGRDKGDLVCCTPGKGHRGRQGAHNPDCRSKHPGIKAEHVATSVCTLLISYPATQGKVSSRVQENSVPAGVFASPEHPSPAGDTFGNWHEQATALQLYHTSETSHHILFSYLRSLDYPWIFMFHQNVLSLLETASSQAQARTSCPSCTGFEETVSSAACLQQHSHAPFLVHKPP